jgi:hypothetical protein
LTLTTVEDEHDVQVLKVGERSVLRFAEYAFSFFDSAFGRSPDGFSFRLADDRFEVRGHNPDFINVIRNGLAWEPAGDTASPCRILLTDRTNPLLPIAPELLSPHFRERHVERSLAGTRYRMHLFPDIGFWQFHDLEEDRAIQFSETPSGFPAWEPGSPLRNFLSWHFSRSGRRLIHAGTLGENGVGILLAGSGGSGKSGTVLSGLCGGLESVGDDYVLASSDDVIRAYPLFSAIKQDPAGLKRVGLEEAPAASGPLNWQGKHLIPLAGLHKPPMRKSIEIRAMCLPKITGGDRTVIRPTDAKQAFLALTPSVVTQVPGDRDQNFAFCGTVSRRLPAFAIDLGRDPEEVCAAITTFIRSLA